MCLELHINKDIFNKNVNNITKSSLYCCVTFDTPVSHLLSKSSYTEFIPHCRKYHLILT